MDASGTTYRGGDHLRLGGADDANIAGRAPGGRQGHLRQRSAGVEDQHRNAGTNSGRPVDAGQVLAMPPKCAVSQPPPPQPPQPPPQLPPPLPPPSLRMTTTRQPIVKKIITHINVSASIATQ